jgi:glucokinase
VRRYRSHGGRSKAVTAERVFALAAEGDAPARAAVREVVDRLALAIANTVVTLDPTVVVIGGGLAAAGDAFFQPLRARIASLVPVAPDMRLTALGPQAALTGAALVAAEDARRVLTQTLERASIVA